MGSYGHDAFNRLDLEVIDRVNEAAWAHDRHQIARDERKSVAAEKSRKWWFALARPAASS